ncbi:galactoside 2-alpha-L-fucosyltransferase Sec1-like [Mercenaria mercenaria]|uniref:galactoside 2-alpha-L-fucosyltransferase Sec1-like n=1 Tax=Mercenaria mercenaria TaxID=6596 RepID=UPI00234E98F1|nr:galactoside 2-alpha-L-fucosyltransferase Sec1-like [Mercenaria mercenaria]
MHESILKSSYNFRVIVSALIGLLFVLSLLTDFYTPHLHNVLETLRTFVYFSSSEKVTYQSQCMIQNISFSNKNCCFRLSSSEHQTLEHLAEKDIQMESGLNKDIEMEDRTERRTVNNLNQLGNQSKPCRCFVTLGDYRGRIGNQMFQIASLVGLAYKYDVISVIPKMFPLAKYFELPNIINLKLNKLYNTVKCVCRKSAAFCNCAKEFNSEKNVTLYGYLQSWKHFKESNEVIKTVFKFKTKHLFNAKRFLSNVSIADFQLVCIHIRRGDITSKAKIAEGYAVAGLDYIEKAKQFFINKYSKVQFLVVSDDKAWCRRHLRNVSISPLTDPGDEMALMTLSDHVVITAGTFGWWGAWLSGGTTVYFSKHPRPGSPLDSRMNKEDYYPPSWIGMA